MRLLGTSQHALLQEAQNDAPGFTFVVRLMTIDFLTPAVLDDELDVVTLPQEVRGRQLPYCRNAGAQRISWSRRVARRRAPCRSGLHNRLDRNRTLL